MSAGKGDKPRQLDGDKYRSNYDNIFRKDETKTKHTDADNSESPKPSHRAARKDRVANRKLLRHME